MRFTLKGVLYWAPRLLAIAFALFLSLFALDVFQEEGSLGQILVAFTIHLIPTFVTVAILLLAWRWEWAGAVLYTGAAALYTSKVLPQHPSWAIGIAGPLLLIAVLFLLDWMLKPKAHPLPPAVQ